MARAVLPLIGAALAAQVLAGAVWGFVAYLWVQGVEAAAASALLLAYGVGYRRHDPRASRWPPLLPLAAVAGAGAVKDFYVALAPETPAWVVALLLGSVGWFFVSSWRVWRAEGRRPGDRAQGVEP
jgi:hypothetical protein